MQCYHQGNKIIISVMGEVILEILHILCSTSHYEVANTYKNIWVTSRTPLEKCLYFFIFFTGGNNRLYWLYSGIPLLWKHGVYSRDYKWRGTDFVYLHVILFPIMCLTEDVTWNRKWSWLFASLMLKFCISSHNRVSLLAVKLFHDLSTIHKYPNFRWKIVYVEQKKSFFFISAL